MRILLLYPQFPSDTFWGFRHALSFIGKKATIPPLGLLTVASMLSKEWEVKLVDLNVQTLRDNDLRWPDFVFISAMVIQKEFVREIVRRAKALKKRIVAGGPLFTTFPEEFSQDIDHLILGEAEDSLPLFLEDLKKEKLKKVYKSETWPDINKTPPPCWELIDRSKYASMGIQLSRGCPFNCEFCNIALLNGRMPRVKNKEQILNELEVLCQTGWRGDVFFVDDNFIGNKTRLKEEILPEIARWQEEKNRPFVFSTQVSINLADDKDLAELMARAGFYKVFVGIESPQEESLKECGKFQNANRNLLESVKTLQRLGLQVEAGFILGFDKDAPSVFDKMVSFIQKSGIATAMVGLLQVPPKTRLWERMKREGRLRSQSSGNNTDCSINFIPKMDADSLILGYKRVLSRIYSPKYYYERARVFLKEYNGKKRGGAQGFSFSRLSAFVKSIWILGVKEKGRVYYWRLFFWAAFKKPGLFPTAIETAIKGFHLRKISEKLL